MRHGTGAEGREHRTAAGDVAEPCARPRTFREGCGSPTLKSLEARSAISDSRLSDVFNGRAERLSWNVVAKVVTALAEHARRTGRRPSLNTDLAYWRDLHGRVGNTPTRPARRPAAAGWTDLVRGHVAWEGVEDDR